ncbi:MAG: MFS transporter [Nocardioidaceae bacterium]
MTGRPRVYGYRWAVLAAFMAVNITIQLLWISYAPVTHAAGRYYGVSTVAIGALAMTFMVVYVPLALPASYLIDRRGLRFASGLGGLLAGVAGLVRGLAGADYLLVLLATIAMAVAQPFLLNAWTTLSVHWFHRSQRATAVGLITLANLVGTGIGMALTPALVKSMSIGSVQTVYGGCALAAGVVFVLVARDNPPTAPDTDLVEGRALMLDGLRHAVKVRPFLVFLAMAFVAMGVFNGVSTWVEEIVRPRGFSATDAGNLGALLLLGGVIGAVVLSALSDRSQRRTPFLGLAFVVAAPALLAVALVDSTLGLFGAAFVLGFFMTSAMPVGLQYAAEITAPTPEGTSNGLVQLVGQASVVFVYLMALTRTSSGSYLPSLGVLACLLLVGGIVAFRLPEPADHLSSSVVLPPTVAEPL